MTQRSRRSAGVPVQYVQSESLSHIASALPWLPEATSWLAARLAGEPPPQDFAQIAPVNFLAPIE
jgi:hypothetical protein